MTFKLNLTCKSTFYLFLYNNRWIEPRHAYTYWFIKVISYILHVFSLNLLSRCCSFHIFKSFVVNFTWSIFFYQLHKFFWNKKIFTGFIHKPSMNSQVKLGTNLIKWKKRISMINFGRNFVIFVKYLLAWHFCCLYFFFWYYKSMSENARKGYTSTLITATTSINLLKSVLTDHQ